MDTTTDPVLRPLETHERPDALRLWYTVFNCPAGYFERYFDADPWHQPGDTLGAWVGGELVSAVHICRRPLLFTGAPLLCGCIANVATLPAYRRHGLSRRLLGMAIDRMTQEAFDFSTLQTGVPGHYAVLGWKSVSLACFSVAISPNALMPVESYSAIPADAASVSQDRRAIYARVPRPLQLDRPVEYDRGWVGWNWRQASAVMLLENEGYSIIQLAKGPNRPARVIEWRASAAAAEETLLRNTVAYARLQRQRRIEFAALPQFADTSTIAAIQQSAGGNTMIRTIRMPADHWQRVEQAYESGAAAWWPADDF